MSNTESNATVLKQLRTKEFLAAPLSRLLEMALEDLAVVERNPDYVIDMSQWHEPQSDGTCEVCLAGSVLANRLALDPEVAYCTCGCCNPKLNKLPHAVHARIEAINSLRIGDIRCAFEGLGLSRPVTVPEDVKVAHYDHDRTLFLRQMSDLVVLLRNAGY